MRKYKEKNDILDDDKILKIIEDYIEKVIPKEN